jgi:signal transduction histidine kinase
VTRKKTPSPDDVRHGWHHGWRIAALLAEAIRAAQLNADTTGREAQAAIERNTQAHAMVSELLRPYRELCTALVGGAGHDGAHPLPEALEAATAALDGHASHPPDGA